MPKLPHMRYLQLRTPVLFLTISSIILVLAVTVLVLKCNCHYFEICQPVTSDIATNDAQSPVPFNASSEGCPVVKGMVLGNIIPGSTLSLFRISSLEPLIVFEDIRTLRPLKKVTVNEQKGFNAGCLFPGNYAFVIPSSSYIGVRGSPLPYEFDCENLSLTIAFQGGDSEYAVGAFSINATPNRNRSECNESTVECLIKRRGLYIKGPLHIG